MITYLELNSTCSDREPEEDVQNDSPQPHNDSPQPQNDSPQPQNDSPHSPQPPGQPARTTHLQPVTGSKSKKENMTMKVSPNNAVEPKDAPELAAKEQTVDNEVYGKEQTGDNEVSGKEQTGDIVKPSDLTELSLSLTSGGPRIGGLIHGAIFVGYFLFL